MATSKKSVKKPVAKKPAAKKPAPAKKAAPAKKPAAKKPEPAKKPAPEKKAPAQKAPVQRKSVVIAKPAPAPESEIDTAKAVAFAMSIAQEMKKSARREENDRIEAEIRLSRRPTTRAQGKSTVKFPAADLKEFRKRLIESRKVATSGVDAIKATGFNETDDREAAASRGSSTSRSSSRAWSARTKWNAAANDKAHRLDFCSRRESRSPGCGRERALRRIPEGFSGGFGR